MAGIESASQAHDDLALLGLLQLVSPALPIGAFAWSQGLESAFELGWVHDEKSLGDWLEGVLEDGLAVAELPALARLVEAWQQGDEDRVAHWDCWLGAVRETRELREEDRQLGASLVRLMRSLGLAPEVGLPDEPGYVTAFSALAVARGLPPRQAMLGFAWAWLENQLAAACKALPLGHTAAQRLVERLRPALVEAVGRALIIDDDDMGPALPGLALASGLHETQYSRLFRS
ncbi:urease accessory protein UreF [Halomonas litopenaei]|uniref:Urease accessory protein UreF n=1 Tax=Halomonas litopenaei TaxID=2109328 RepID=A0ABX5IXU8_9GAMM|nr:MULTISPECIES: urease accessory protein UreF [Halomonas]PTL90771.1 urease accessory protein UreF [Halomonas sp. SYSU XM8]PTL93365.1 urease accessory protein UreF [Halomonas litopenaei]USZ48201.1 urease accessory protein UreF [Halomonas sp. DN3]